MAMISPPLYGSPSSEKLCCARAHTLCPGVAPAFCKFIGELGHKNTSIPIRQPYYGWDQQHVDRIAVRHVSFLLTGRGNSEHVVITAEAVARGALAQGAQGLSPTRVTKGIFKLL